MTTTTESALVRNLRLAALVASGIAAVLFIAEEIAAADLDRRRRAPRRHPG